MKGIELDIAYDTDYTKSLSDCGIDVNIEDCIVRKILFYNIDSINRFMDEDKYSTVRSGGESFICIDNYEVLKKKIYEKAS